MVMEVDFATAILRRLAEDPNETAGFSQAVAKAYRRRVQFILAAVDERDLYGMKSLHFEKLRGSRDGERSIRLNDQWRLIVEVVPGNPRNTIRIIEIADYHK